MDIVEIRQLASARRPNYPKIAADSQMAILLGPLTPMTHAELLCYYVEAASHMDPTL